MNVNKTSGSLDTQCQELREEYHDVRLFESKSYFLSSWKGGSGWVSIKHALFSIVIPHN